MFFHFARQLYARTIIIFFFNLDNLKKMFNAQL